MLKTLRRGMRKQGVGPIEVFLGYPSEAPVFARTLPPNGVAGKMVLPKESPPSYWLEWLLRLKHRLLRRVH